ncbi:hypothetical protein [Micromonospora sp. RP3T]|uniref:hypothetical protein n=1 Tax=Micromonospora sp. RP3T TaxID=2135446 RepID=UPI003D748165
MFEVGGIRFGCWADECRLGRLERYLRSYFPTVTTSRHPTTVDVAVRFVVSDAEFERSRPCRPADRVHTAHIGAPYDLWEEHDALVYAYPATASGGDPAGDHLFRVGPVGVAVVARERSREPERLLRHLVTEVLIASWEDQGAVSLHAASAATVGRAGSIEERGRSVLIAGPKGAGKTTTVTMLGCIGMDLCSNDRTLVIAGSGRTLGLPMAYRLGHGQVHSEPKLAGFLDCGPERNAPCEPSRKHYVTPAGLAEALGTGIQPGGWLALVLLPRLTPDDRTFWHAPASAEEVTSQLTACCYTPNDPAIQDPRFWSRRVPLAVRAATAQAACRRLADQFPAWKVGWGTGTDLDHVRRGLRELVHGRHG